MNCFLGRVVPLAGLAVFAAAAQAGAHDFLRRFGPLDSSPGLGPVRATEFTRSDPFGLDRTPAEEAQLRDKYNFAIGPIRFALAAGIGVEWNDNITFAERHRKADFIVRPSLDIDATWPMSELHTLRFALGLGYAKYFNHSKFDAEGLLVSPDSQIELRFALGAFQFAVRDRFSYQEDPSDVPPLSNQAVYRRAENQIGMTATWEASEFFKLTGGYDHENLWTVDSEFSSEDRAVDTLFLRPTFQLVPHLSIGLKTAFSFITFDRGEREDGMSLMVGPVLEWKISEATKVVAEAGLQRLSFEGESSFDNGFFAKLDPDERALFRDDDDSTGAYFRFEIANRSGDLFEQSLSASKTAEIGFGSNFYDLFHIEYNATYKGLRSTEIGPAIFYEFYKTSGGLDEEASRAGLLFSIRHHVTNALTLGLDYRFLWKDSNIENLSYYQNLIFVSVHYKF
jgi:hypothetical protein